MSTPTDYGVQRMVASLNDTLMSYIEAQYHVRDESLIAERHSLLCKDEIIRQRPFVEATPVYAAGPRYQSLDVPDEIRQTLSDLSRLQPAVGVFDPPYQHQATAIEAFIRDGEDLIVATGTGSGKTESFLLPILSSLLLEGTERKQSAMLPGCRRYCSIRSMHS